MAPRWEILRCNEHIPAARASVVAGRRTGYANASEALNEAKRLNSDFIQGVYGPYLVREVGTNNLLTPEPGLGHYDPEGFISPGDASDRHWRESLDREAIEDEWARNQARL